MRTIDDLTASAIGDALCAAGTVASPPASATVEPLDAGIGLLGSLARVRLTWPGTSDGPASLVAKLAPTDAGNDRIVRRFRYDEREAGVYRDLRPWEKVRSPTCLAQGWNEDEHHRSAWLLLEDLGHFTTGDQVLGATEAEAFQVVEALAAWHATWWADESLQELPWLPHTGSAEVAGYGEIFDATWPVCIEKLKGAIGSDDLLRAEGARREFDGALQEFSAGPRTLVHGDARLDNVRFGPEGAALLDFQLATHSRGAYDLAFFCAGSLTTEARRRLEPALLDRYLACLRAGGVDDYHRSDLHHDYRLGHIVNLPNPVSALAVVSPGSERGAEFLLWNAIRGITATADHIG